MASATLRATSAERVDAVTGAQALVLALENAGVDTVFGVPGGAILPAYDALFDSATIRHVLVRHEQGAGHAATGYAQASGRVGVCVATSGPGATNLVTPLADAYRDSVPVVMITGQVPSEALGTDAFQEVDIYGVTMPITKHNYLVTDPGEIVGTIAEGFEIAAEGRPGPVLVDITKDALQGLTEFRWPRHGRRRDRPRRPASANPRRILDAARLIAAARRPVLYVGGGVLKARATEELMALAQLTLAPVTTTLMARGAFPDSHPQHLGMPGMHGSVAAVLALQRADLIVALGARFDDRVTGRIGTFAQAAKIIQVDVDPSEISKNRRADVPIVGDARQVLAALTAAVRGERDLARPPGLDAWWAELDDVRARYPVGYDLTPDGSLSPQLVIERIGRLAPPDTTFVSGVGQHQMWASQLLRHERPHRWINSGGAGTMGFAVPAAMGAKVARPTDAVWVIDGDGCFQMTSQELVTCAINGIPIKVGIIDNGVLGMVRQWQTLFYGERYSNTTLRGETTAGVSNGGLVPDFVKMAEAMGCIGLRCDDVVGLDAVIEKANSVTDCPVVVDFVVSRESMVWPMVAAGVSNDEIMVARGVRPDFGDPTSQ